MTDSLLPDGFLKKSTFSKGFLNEDPQSNQVDEMPNSILKLFSSSFFRPAFK